MSNPAHMWTYWRDKQGVVDALVYHYPDRLNDDPELRQALYQINAAKALIDQKMKALADEEDT